MHEGRGANGEKQVARTAHGERALDGVGWQSSAAAWTPRWHIAAFLPFVDDLVLCKTFCATDIAVKFDNIATAGALVEAVHVLGDQSEAWQTAFEFHQRVVTGVGQDFGDQLAPPGIPFPDEFWVALKRFRRGQVLGSEI